MSPIIKIKIEINVVDFIFMLTPYVQKIWSGSRYLIYCRESKDILTHPAMSTEAENGTTFVSQQTSKDEETDRARNRMIAMRNRIHQDSRTASWGSTGIAPACSGSSAESYFSGCPGRAQALTARSMMTGLIIALSAVGLYISAYFTLVYYGVISPSGLLMPSFCRMEEQSCARVVQTTYARVFKVPNFVLGVIYYASLIVLAGLGFPGIHFFLWAACVVAWLAVGLGGYLIHALIYKLKTPCPLCYISHTINLALAVLMSLLLTG